MDDRERIRELERQLAELRAREIGDDGGGRVQIVKRPLAESDTDRITALERQLEEVIGEARSVVRAGDQRPAIQVIQRTEVETGGKKQREPTLAEERAGQVMAWGCAIAMVLWTAWCISLGSAAATLLP
ncbi:MAG: hypothetical protein F4087_01585 [Gemmatimonadetes bacterium]|nr:hypothetical protein [Gemmatimonadota bacterium]MYE93621.1 hypothetical protein [Gemmatimonadota bacterium]MYJ67190.1 hypothetical protein [Gemmatimonadota bacterium]